MTLDAAYRLERAEQAASTFHAWLRALLSEERTRTLPRDLGSVVLQVGTEVTELERTEVEQLIEQPWREVFPIDGTSLSVTNSTVDAQQLATLQVENQRLRADLRRAEDQLALLDESGVDCPGDHGSFLAAARAFFARIGFSLADLETFTLASPATGRFSLIKIKGESLFQVQTSPDGVTWARWLALPLTQAQAARERELIEKLRAAELHAAAPTEKTEGPA